MQTARILVALFNGLCGVPVKQAQEGKPGYPELNEKPTTEIVIKIGNMMSLSVDAIVNAANSRLQGGGGIDGIITENKDPRTGAQLVPPQGDRSGEILYQLRMLQKARMQPLTRDGQLPVGSCVITGSGSIIDQQAHMIRYVISTVGPKGPDSDDMKDRLLYNAYVNALLLASNDQGFAQKMLQIFDPNLADDLAQAPIKTIAFPAISTGIYNYPLFEASAQAIHACLDFVRTYPRAFDTIYLVFLSENDPAYKAICSFIQEYKQMVDDPCAVIIRFEN